VAIARFTFSALAPAGPLMSSAPARRRPAAPAAPGEMITAMEQQTLARVGDVVAESLSGPAALIGSGALTRWRRGMLRMS
jgi:hypothetical protein